MITAFHFCIAYIIVDVLCLVETIIIASNVSRDSGTEMQVRSFFLLLTANLVFVVFDAAWAFSAYSGLFSPSVVLLEAINCVALTSLSFAGFFWFFFCLAHFDKEKTRRRSTNIGAASFAILAPILHVIGNATGLTMTILPDGSLSYGLIHVVVTCIPLLYLIAATVVAARARKRATTKAERHICSVFIMFMVAPAAAGVFAIFVPDMPAAAAGVIISLVFVIMSMQESRISSDVLTGLNNRRRAEAFLEESMAHASHEHPVYLFIIDMDRFKSINDKFGHLEGDHALRLMSEALRRTCSEMNAFAARWGGDEFVMICANVDNEPASVADVIRNDLAGIVHDAHVDYDLTCTVGWAACESAEENRTQLIADADGMLYRNKRDSR